MLVMVVFFIAFRWIHLSTPLIRLFLLVLILLLIPTLNFLPVWFALSLLRFRLPSRLPMMFILWMVAMMVVIIPSRTVCLLTFFFFQAEDGIRDLTVTGVQTCALPIYRALIFTRTKHGADKVVKGLARAGITADAIHGNKSQNHRERVLAAFRTGEIRTLDRKSVV